VTANDGGANGTTAQLHGSAAQAAQQEQLTAILGQINQLCAQVTSLQYAMESSITSVRTDFGKQFSVVNRNVGRVTSQASHRRVPAAEAAAGAVDGATVAGIAAPMSAAVSLSPNPKHLADLWTEWCHGIGPRKAARNFSAAERGTVKRTFSKRKNAWDLIARLVDAGFSSTAAISKVYQAYGTSLSMSQLLEAIRKDKAQGGHPSLRILIPSARTTQARTTPRNLGRGGRGGGGRGRGRGRGRGPSWVQQDGGRGRGGRWTGVGRSGRVPLWAEAYPRVGVPMGPLADPNEPIDGIFGTAGVGAAQIEMYPLPRNCV
jgi:hypothetical protein